MSDSLSISSELVTEKESFGNTSGGPLTWRIRAFDVISILTLLQCIYLTFAAQNYFQFAILIKLLVIAALWPSFRRSSFLWLSVVLLWLPTLVFEWCNHEDHVYFAIYWCAALGLATWKPVNGAIRSAAETMGSPEWHADTEALLRRSARYLIGLCFLFATVWKIVSPEFHDGRLFHYKLLCDDRFSETLTRIPGGMNVPAIQANYVAVQQIRGPEAVADAATLGYPERISWMAWLMTWWTIAIEGFLAIAFLWPAGRRLNWIRNLALIGFAFSTYIIAPVMGYGFTFMIMGYANCETKDRRMRSVFLGSLVVLAWILIFRDTFVPSEIRDFHESIR